MSSFTWSEDERRLIQSHDAYLSIVKSQQQYDWQVESPNGMIVSDSESDDPDDYVDLDMASKKAQVLIVKKKKSIRRRARYLKAKAIAERKFLHMKGSPAVRGILKEF